MFSVRASVLGRDASARLFAGLGRLILWLVAIVVLPAWAGPAAAPFERAFIEPPLEARPWVYWYWMNGNITREGALEDLRALHRVGIGGVFLMDIGIHPAGPVAYRSQAWFEITTAVVSEAKKLGMQVAFHCPGWSASGGPWVTPEKGMQEVVWSETIAEGAKEGQSTGKIQLAQPPARLNTYRDIAVIAFPSLKQDENLMQTRPFKLVADGREIQDASKAFDGLPDTAAVLPNQFEIVFDQLVRARSLFIRGARAGGDFAATLEAADGTGTFRKIAELHPEHPGPFSSIQGSVSFGEVEAARFRITYRDQAKPPTPEEIVLSSGFRVDDWPAHAGYSRRMAGISKQEKDLAKDDAIALDRGLDLTDKMDENGVLEWRPPAGERWTLLRFGYVPTGIKISPAPIGGDGLECDKMSREVTDFHYDAMVKPLLKAYAPILPDKGFVTYHIDSYEAGCQNWTPKMPEAFQKSRGYALTCYLPALTGRVVGSYKATLGFLSDFRRVIGDLYADGHYGRIAERCHQDGLAFSTEAYGGPFENLQVAGRADFPMVEFWTGERNKLPVDQSAPRSAIHGIMAAHTYGRRIIGSEAFTSEEGWLIHPYSLKSLGDRMFATGINRFVLHVSAHQAYLREGTYPGLTCGLNGIHFDRGNTWFEHGAKEWVGYLTRSQAVLQQGLHVADALYFQGNDSPSEGSLAQPALPQGYDYDTLNSERLALLQVRDGRLYLPDGKQYRYLVMPQHGRVTYMDLKRVARLVEAGASVLGAQPKESPSLMEQREQGDFQQLASRLWRDGLCGQGRILHEKSFGPILEADGVPPDFSWTSPDGLALHFTHRQAETEDVYFVANGLKKAGAAQCRFRTAGGAPQRWNPVDGSRVPLTEYTVEPDGRVTIPVWFDESDSFFIVFDRKNTVRRTLEVEADETGAEPLKMLTILRAQYGAKDTFVDLTQQIQAKVKENRLELSGFTQFMGDPVPFVRKTLTVDYELDGKPATVSVQDGETLTLPARVPARRHDVVREAGEVKLIAYAGGTYTVDGADYSARVPQAQNIGSSAEWTINFQKNRGAPERIVTRELKTLGAFDEDGVKHFSGRATYRTSFGARRAAGDMRFFLDLGEVAVVATAHLNGRLLGTCWKPPFRFDITDSLRDGANALEVEVTTTWVNRLIGDEQFPDDVSPNKNWTKGGMPCVPEWLVKGLPRPELRRVTFAAFKYWKATDPLHPAGLIGPVRLEAASVVRVKTVK